MPFALTFTGDVDPVALAIFILALVTLAVLAVVLRALQVAQRGAERWRAEAEEAQRPVVVPIHTPVHMPLFAGHGQLLIPVENIGSGPAVTLTVFVTPRDADGAYSDAWGETRHTGVASGLAAAKVSPVEVRVWGLGAMSSYDIWVTYSDLAGREWVTSAKYLASENGSRYINQWIKPVPDGQSARGWLGFG